MRVKQPADETAKKESDAAGLLCMIGVFVNPPFLIFVFIRLLITRGAPDWYLWLHGVLCVMSIVLVMNLFRNGLFRAVRDYSRGRRRERSKG